MGVLRFCRHDCNGCGREELDESQVRLFGCCPLEGWDSGSEGGVWGKKDGKEMKRKSRFFDRTKEP